MEEKPLYSGLTVYRERGAYLRRLEQFAKAKHAYNEARKFDSEDVRTLIGRSQACSDMLDSRQAYADADLALKLEPQNMTAKTTQARAMFTMCEFEQSLMMNHRGAKLRHQPPYFNDGIIQGQETMQDCIGENAGDVFVELFPFIRSTLTNYAGDLEPVKRLHVSRIPKMESKKRLTKVEARKHETLSRVLAMKYLGSMANDKFFLQTLMEDPRLQSANSVQTEEIKNLVQEALGTLRTQQDLLRAQQPYYSIKHAEKCESSRLAKFKEETLATERKSGSVFVNTILRELQKCVYERRINDLITKAQRLQSYLDGRTLQNLPGLDDYTDRLYQIVGEGYLCQYRVSTKISEKNNRRRVLFLLGLPIGRATSHDSVLENYPHRFINFQMEIRKKNKELEVCENPYMACWLYFELARLEKKMKNFALSNFYARKCQQQSEALKPTSAVWWINACFVLMSTDMLMDRTQDAKMHIEKALEMCKDIPHAFDDQVRNFLRFCLQVVTQPFEYLHPPERLAQMKREKAIIGVLDERAKGDAAVLFKRMSVIPSGRRFSVLPKAQEVKMTSERRKVRQRGLSIIPGV